MRGHSRDGAEVYTPNNQVPQPLLLLALLVLLH
jgi:hypothetical protein